MSANEPTMYLFLKRLRPRYASIEVPATTERLKKPATKAETSSIRFGFVDDDNRRLVALGRFGSDAVTLLEMASVNFKERLLVLLPFGPHGAEQLLQSAQSCQLQ